MKRILAGLLFLLVALPVAADETVTFKSGSEEVSGFLAKPEGKGPFPGVVVVQEWWGLTDWVKARARDLAKEGYVALAPDLYRGKATKDAGEAHQLMMGAPHDRMERDLRAAFDALAARPDVRKDRIGVIGWCMGGGLALGLAVAEPRLAAVVAYYGAPPTDPGSIAKIKAPVLGNYGGEDKGPSPDTVKGFEAAMKKAGKPIDVKIYPGAGHAFANEENPFGTYRQDAAKDAWARTQKFLAQRLKA